MDILKTIFDAQRELNRKTLANSGINYDKICETHDEEWLLKYSRAQIHETLEFEDELNWKHWKTPTHININAAKEELIDELHFWVSKCQIMGMGAEEVLHIYLKKNGINHERQSTGY